MSRWKYHLNPDTIKAKNELIGIYCPKCKKVGGIVTSVPILKLRNNKGKDTKALSSMIKCKECRQDVRIDIYKHLVRMNYEGQRIPPNTGEYTTQW